MKKRIISGFLCLVLAVSAVFFIPSCSSVSTAPPLDDVKERLVYLIEESKEINSIFFGVGLPVYRRDSDISERKAVYNEDSLKGFDRITEESRHITVESIKKSAEKVYSANYLSDLYEGAFDGILTGNTGAYLRFYDDTRNMYQNSTLHDFKVNERIYDYSTMEIVKPSSADYINVSVQSYSISDKKRQTLTLSFIFENGDWYLDSPTY